jgi:hypothetical protein
VLTIQEPWRFESIPNQLVIYSSHVVVLLLLQAITNEVIETSSCIGTHMLHHLGIQTPFETSDLLSISVNHVKTIMAQIIESMQILIHHLGALIQR